MNRGVHRMVQRHLTEFAAVETRRVLQEENVEKPFIEFTVLAIHSASQV